MRFINIRLFSVMSSTLFILFAQTQLVEADAVNQLSKEEAAFLKNHWPNQIPLQGKPPKDFSELETSLEPEKCGHCHEQQYQDWKATIHSKAMGPGILGQLVEMLDGDPMTARLCWSCHTPLPEQQDLLLQGDEWQQNARFDPGLQAQGLVCAACHVRQHQRFGPPSSKQPDNQGKINDDLPHDGFTATTAFSNSAFCKGCHQFEPDDYSLNGKLIENTYNEWLESKYPAQGVHCQTCHMPERRHLWRGIHDPEMVKKGVTISVELEKKSYKVGDPVEAKIILENVGVGHYFPTYLTPKVFVRAYLIDKQGVPVEATRQEAIIGREVTLDISQELFDTRIPPHDSLAITYSRKIPSDGMRLGVEVIVDPDHFYARFYQAVLENGGGGKGRAMLEQALENALNSSFSIYQQEYPLEL